MGDFFVLINYYLVKVIFSGEPEKIFKKFESLEENYWRLVCCLRVTFTFTVRKKKKKKQFRVLTHENDLNHRRTS